MRIIMHVDMNSYFATAEQQANPFLRGKPLCIAGKGSGNSSDQSKTEVQRTVCAALSIEAKKFGLKSGVSTWEARQKCPDIIIVPADYTKYHFISREVFGILESFTPMVEIFSIDEAFLDLTGLIETIDEAIIIAKQIKIRIRTEIGDYLMCSVGISFNKILAKLASEMQKPDGLTIIDKNNYLDILKKTPVEELCGIGPKLSKKLNLLGIKTLAAMGEYDTEKLIKFFGPFYGKTMHLWGNGIDNSQVLPYYLMPMEKTYGHSYTLPKNIFKPADAKKVLLKLSEKVGRRMRKGKTFGRTVCFYIRYFDFTGSMEQTTSQRFINDGFEIYKIALKLMGRNQITKPIRAIGVSVNNLKKNNQISQPILIKDRKNEQILKTIDAINDRYGEFALFRSSLTAIKDKIQNIPDGRNRRF